jgi:hypothetical protein
MIHKKHFDLRTGSDQKWTCELRCAATTVAIGSSIIILVSEMDRTLLTNDLGN